MNFSGIAGMWLLTFFIGAAILMGGSPAIFVNIPSAIIVGLCTVTLGLTTFGAADLLQSAMASRILIFKLPIGDLKRGHAEILRGLILYSYAGAVIGMTIGIIQILATLADLSTLAGSLAICFLCPF